MHQSEFLNFKTMPGINQLIAVALVMLVTIFSALLTAETGAANKIRFILNRWRP